MLKNWIAALRYEGQHRGRYQPMPQWQPPPVPVEPVFLGTRIQKLTFYGLDGPVTGTLTIVPDEGISSIPALADLARSA